MISLAVLAVMCAAPPFPCAELAATLERIDAKERSVIEEYERTQIVVPPPVDADSRMLAAYAEYLCTGQDAQPCDGGHALIGVVNALWRWNAKEIDDAGFAKALVAIEDGAGQFYRIDSLLHERGVNLAPCFAAKTGDFPAFAAITPVFDAVTPDTPEIAEAVARLVESSDGYYAEWVLVELARILAERPEIVAPHLNTWNRIAGRIASGFAFFGEEHHVERIRAHWTSSPDSPAKTAVLAWLAEAAEDKAAFEREHG